MNSEDLKSRTKLFAHRCVKLASALPKNILGKYLESQLTRSALSVAANYRAVCFAQSSKEFVSKTSIVLEEADESNFWITFIEDEKLIDPSRLRFIKQESIELTKIFAASRLTARKKQQLKKVVTKP